MGDWRRLGDKNILELFRYYDSLIKWSRETELTGLTLNDLRIETPFTSPPLFQAFGTWLCILCHIDFLRVSKHYSDEFPLNIKRLIFFGMQNVTKNTNCYA